jgi:hypothetical protein
MLDVQMIEQNPPFVEESTRNYLQLFVLKNQFRRLYESDVVKVFLIHLTTGANLQVLLAHLLLGASTDDELISLFIGERCRNAERAKGGPFQRSNLLP